jgi:uncharacterized protein (TIRG00374 family)
MDLEDPQQETSIDASQPDRARPSGRRSLLLNLVTVAVTVIFSYLALKGINLERAWRALRSSDYLWLAPALGAFGLAMFTRAVRWRSLFAPERRPALGTVGNAMMVGYLYNNILPARAGEVARVLVLRSRGRTQPAEILGTVVLERLYDVLGILVVFFAATPWLPKVSWLGPAELAAAILAVAIGSAALVLAIYGERPLHTVLRPLRRFELFSGERLEHTVAELVHGLSGLRHGTVAIVAFAWTLLAWLLSSLCAYFVTVAFHLHMSFACGILVTVAIGAGMILPSPPAAVGVFEGATLIALRVYHIPHSAALSYALVLHLVNFVPFIAVGAGLLHHNARHPPTVPANDEPALPADRQLIRS